MPDNPYSAQTRLASTVGPDEDENMTEATTE